MHTKEGEIFEFKNAGLVTDPGPLNPLPTILSGLAGTSSKGPPMDKKRMMMDCFCRHADGHEALPGPWRQRWRR